MTLDEAIKHCEEIACNNTNCALEHKQLAEWLSELKKRRNLDSITEPVSEDLEEEISNYIKNNFFGSGSIGFLSNRTKGELDSVDVVNIARHFAEWQKDKMKETLQTEYEKGRFDMREEMMKDTVECVVEDWCGNSPEITIPLNPQDFKTGDKVKIIIVKTEQQ